jgi:hypothetical protein
VAVYRWHWFKGQVHRWGDGKRHIYLHRVVLDLDGDPSIEVHQRNGNGLDCRRSNLCAHPKGASGIVAVNGVAYIPLHARDCSIHAWTQVEAADLPLVDRWRWSFDGRYAYRRENGRSMRMHRQILGLPLGDPREGDHLNRDKLDNRRANLRIATRSENGQNLPTDSYGQSGCRGVSWSAQKGRWRARFNLAGRDHHVGFFDDPEEAAAAVASARQEQMPFATP